MPRKKVTPSFILNEEPVINKVEFKPREGKMIKNEVMYSSLKLTDVVGVVMAGEIVEILDIDYNHSLAFIRTNITNRIGYIDSKSVL